jgi:D-alanyl-D-alanine carboxypeptidase
MNLIVYILTLFSLVSCSENRSNYTNNDANNITLSADSISDAQKKSIPEGLLKLVKAYPDFIEKADENNLYFKDGTVIEWDDGVTGKTHDEMLDSPDLEDMMQQKYVKGANWDSPPAENFEPGRIRYEPFFKKMYGSSSGEVKQNLVTVNWVPSICGCSVQANRVNGMAEKLQAVSDEIEATLGAEFHKYLSRTGGTFNWRNIAGTNRLSTHAFGTSIDINTNYSNYWQWDGDFVWKNKIPMEIVEIFEKYGFIWGGKWYHYDTMHFEYRPELLVE